MQELDGCANRFDNLAVKIVLLLATFLLEDVEIDLDFPSYLRGRMIEVSMDCSQVSYSFNP